ncbi:hypothetical protein QUF70_11300, partial [Desulfobacterales bacterium HSG17]|nr:hypothetical protein [Desulfobacterales bacterium HSG17]
ISIIIFILLMMDSYGKIKLEKPDAENSFFGTLYAYFATIIMGICIWICLAIVFWIALMPSVYICIEGYGWLYSIRYVDALYKSTEKSMIAWSQYWGFIIIFSLTYIGAMIEIVGQTNTLKNNLIRFWEWLKECYFDLKCGRKMEFVLDSVENTIFAIPSTFLFSGIMITPLISIFIAFQVLTSRAVFSEIGLSFFGMVLGKAMIFETSFFIFLAVFGFIFLLMEISLIGIPGLDWVYPRSLWNFCVKNVKEVFQVLIGNVLTLTVLWGIFQVHAGKYIPKEWFYVFSNFLSAWGLTMLYLYLVVTMILNFFGKPGPIILAKNMIVSLSLFIREWIMEKYESFLT